jgi:hypothetical protein
VSVRVIDRDTGDVTEYANGTGVNYDAQGFAVVVTGEGDSATSIAVWAPGTWQHADLDTAEASAL